MSVYHEAVLRFDPGTLQWTQVGHTIYTVSIQYLPSIYNDLSPAVTTLH